MYSVMRDWGLKRNWERLKDWIGEICLCWRCGILYSWAPFLSLLVSFAVLKSGLTMNVKNNSNDLDWCKICTKYKQSVDHILHPPSSLSMSHMCNIFNFSYALLSNIIIYYSLVWEFNGICVLLSFACECVVYVEHV